MKIVEKKTTIEITTAEADEIAGIVDELMQAMRNAGKDKTDWEKYSRYREIRSFYSMIAGTMYYG